MAQFATHKTGHAGKTATLAKREARRRKYAPDCRSYPFRSRQRVRYHGTSQW